MAPVPLETIRGWFETACCPTGLDSLLSDRFGTACCPTGLAPVPLETMRGWFETACWPMGSRQLVGRQVLDSLLSDSFARGWFRQ